MGTGATAKGVPYPVAADNNDVPADLLALANWIDGRPGTAVHTTGTRDALAGPELWPGRLIWNTTTSQIEGYVGGVWGPVAGPTRTSFAEIWFHSGGN